MEEEISRNQKNDDIKPQHKVPGLDTSLLRKVDGNEISATTGGIGPETETDRSTAENSAEDSDQQRIVSNGKAGNKVCQKAAHHDHQQRQKGELLPHKAKAYIYRECVQKKVDGGIGKLQSKKFLRKTLD